MKPFAFLLFITIYFNQTSAQYSIRASMGIDLVNSPSLNDYINQSGLTGGNSVKDFNTAINFSGEFCYSLSESMQMGLEAGYSINSFNYTTDLGKFELVQRVISPTLLAYYLINGTGYNFKFGGGTGLRFVSVNISLPGTNTDTKYTNTGFGLILRAEGNTLLGENVYANIGANLRYDLNGIPKNGGTNLYNSISRSDVNLNSFAFGLYLGIIIIL